MKLEKDSKQARKVLHRENVGHLIRNSALRTLGTEDDADDSEGSETSTTVPRSKKKNIKTSASSAIELYNHELLNLKQDRANREQLAVQHYEEEHSINKRKLDLDQQKWETEKELALQNVENEKSKLENDKKKLEIDTRKLDLEENRLKLEAEYRIKELESRDAKDLAMINAISSLVVAIKKD